MYISCFLKIFPFVRRASLLGLQYCCFRFAHPNNVTLNSTRIAWLPGNLTATMRSSLIGFGFVTFGPSHSFSRTDMSAVLNSHLTLGKKENKRIFQNVKLLLERQIESGDNYMSNVLHQLW